MCLHCLLPPFCRFCHRLLLPVYLPDTELSRSGAVFRNLTRRHQELLRCWCNRQDWCCHPRSYRPVFFLMFHNISYHKLFLFHRNSSCRETRRLRTALHFAGLYLPRLLLLRRHATDPSWSEADVPSECLSTGSDINRRNLLQNLRCRSYRRKIHLPGKHCTVSARRDNQIRSR